MSSEHQSGLASAFAGVGQRLTNHGGKISLGVVLFTLLCAAGALNLDSLTDPVAMYTPTGNQATAERAAYHATFGNDDVAPSSFIITQHNPTETVLTQETFQLAADLHADILAATFSDPTGATNRTLSLSDICTKLPTGECFVNSVLRCSGYQVASGTPVVTYPACVDAIGVPVVTTTSLGDVEVASNGFMVESAKSLRFDYIVPTGTADGVLYASTWEPVFAKTVAAFAAKHDDTIAVSYLTVTSIGMEAAAAANADMSLLLVSMLIFGLMLAAMSCNTRQVVHSRGMVVFTCCAAMTLAIITTVGICGLLGVAFAPIVAMVPFVLMANTAETVFLLNASFTSTYSRYVVPVRLGKALARVGPSLVASALIQTVIGAATAFIATMPAISSLGAYLAIGTAINCAYQLIVYSSALASDGRREAKGSYAWLPCLAARDRTKLSSNSTDEQQQSARSEADTVKAVVIKTASRIVNSRGESMAKPAGDVPVVMETEALVKPKPPMAPPQQPGSSDDSNTDAQSTSSDSLDIRPSGGEGTTAQIVKASAETRTPRPASHVVVIQPPTMGRQPVITCTRVSKSDDTKASAVTSHTSTGPSTTDENLNIPIVQPKVRRKWPSVAAASSIGTYVLKTPARCFVIVTLLALAVVGGVWISNAGVGMDTRELLFPDSPVQTFLNTQEQQFRDVGLPHFVVIDNRASYWDPVVQSSVASLVTGLQASDATAEFPPVDSWLAAFTTFVTESGLPAPTDESTFVATLFAFLMQPQYMRYRLDLVLASPVDDSVYALTDTDFTGGVYVKASRLTVYSKPAYSSAEQSALMKELRRVVLASVPTTLQPTFVYHQMFQLFEQLEVVRPLFVSVCGVAALSILVVSAVTQPRAASTLLTVLANAVAFLIGLGFTFGPLGVELNTITLPYCIMAVAVAVGYPAHAAAALAQSGAPGSHFPSAIVFNGTTGPSAAAPPRNASTARGRRSSISKAVATIAAKSYIGGPERLRRAYSAWVATAPAALRSALATCCSLLALAFASSYTTTTVACTLVPVLTASMVVAALLVPVLGSIIGPSGVARFQFQRASVDQGAAQRSSMKPPTAKQRTAKVLPATIAE